MTRNPSPVIASEAKQSIFLQEPNWSSTFNQSVIPAKAGILFATASTFMSGPRHAL